MIVAWAICHWGYKLDEDEYAKIVKELAERHKADELAAANAQPALAAAGASAAPAPQEAPKDDTPKSN
jgi:ribosomal protein L12E/L44/L45/RPP1/RPP2